MQNLLNQPLLRSRWLTLALAVGIGLSALSGCSSIGSGRKKSTGGIFGHKNDKKVVELTKDGSLAPMRGQEEYDAAERYYKQEQYDDAEKAFKKVSTKYADSPIEEHALFMLAESQFKQEKYPRAQDSYNRLMTRFENSRYLDKATFRLFAIAQEWLDSPEPVSQGEIIQATGGDDPQATPQPVERISRPFPLIPNLTDRKRPLFDRDGRAIEALRSIWLNNPTGKLADDAIMFTAVHHYRTGNFLEAARFFTMLRENYPDSQHAANAYQFGAHVEQLNHQGPEYDSQGLDKAAELVRSTLSLFPNEVDKDRLHRTLAHIQHEKARKDWNRVLFRLKRGENGSAEMLCVNFLKDHPNSAFTQLASETLTKLKAERQPEDVGGASPVDQFNLPELPEAETEESYEEDPGEFPVQEIPVADPYQKPNFEDVPDLFADPPANPQGEY